MYNRFPTANAESKRRFAIAVWHQQNDFFCCADDQRNHDQPKREPTGVSREAFETQYDESVNHHTPGDRWNAVEHVGHKPHQRIHASRAIFSKVNSAQNAHRNSNYRSESEELKRTHNCVHHSAANYTDRLRQFGEEVPVHGTGAVGEKMKKYEPQRRDHKKRRNERDRRRQRTFDFAPGVVVCSSRIHSYCTARVADVVPIVCRRICATRFARIVVPKSTSPISNNAWRYISVVASVNSFAITLARVYPGLKSDAAICGVLPITIVTAMVSPRARPRPRMTAPNKPFLA